MERDAAGVGQHGLGAIYDDVLIMDAARLIPMKELWWRPLSESGMDGDAG